jgi:hypothetical protein
MVSKGVVVVVYHPLPDPPHRNTLMGACSLHASPPPSCALPTHTPCLPLPLHSTCRAVANHKHAYTHGQDTTRRRWGRHLEGKMRLGE